MRARPDRGAPVAGAHAAAASRRASGFADLAALSRPLTRFETDPAAGESEPFVAEVVWAQVPSERDQHVE